MIWSRNKILRSGDSCYPAYPDPLVSLFGIFSLWRPATSVKINGYLRWVNQFSAWMFSIDWYLNWPHWTFISWDMVHWHVLGGLGARRIRGSKNQVSILLLFFTLWVNRPRRNRFRQKNRGSKLPWWARRVSGSITRNIRIFIMYTYIYQYNTEIGTF